MVKQISLIILFFLPFISFSQLFQNETCGVSNKAIFSKNNNVNIEDLYLFLDSCNYSPYKNDIKYRIPIKFWIYQKKNGKGGLKLSEIKTQIRNLNYYYDSNNVGISFYIRPDIEYINNNRLYKLNYYSQAPFQTIKHKSKGCINVHVTEKLEKPRLFRIKKNYSGTFNNLSDGVIIAQGVSSTTLSHEVGHFLGLKHPHENWKSKTKGEPVSRTKLIPGTNTLMCEKKGDGLCDTPAEPNLSNYTDDDCRYTGWNVKDKYGVVYKPNTNNIMSYTKNRECRNNFTEQQKALILYTISRKKYAKNWATNIKNAELYDFDYFEPDDNKEMATEIYLRTKQTHTFHKIYIPKKNKCLYDNTDWLFFKLDVKKPKDITIYFSKNKYPFPNIIITIYKNDKEISETTLNKNKIKNIKLQKLTKGIYYIKIQRKSNLDKISAYKIKIEN